jgi:hypothetical protein
MFTDIFNFASPAIAFISKFSAASLAAQGNDRLTKA